MDLDDEDFVSYGTPLEPLEEDNVPRKKAFTVEDQIVTDEHGRRRFHGAFTGGFSAGFYNTVGTPQGWEPSTFKSSRNTRMQTKEQSAFDFMDDEDMSEHGICPMSVQVKSSFDNKSIDRSELKRKGNVGKSASLASSNVVQNVFKPVRVTIGVKLLMKMGWKPGQGVGPRITMKQKKRLRKERENMGKVYGCELPSNISKYDSESEESDIDVDLEGITFAPDDYKTYIAQPKLNLFGLGYQGMDRRTVLSSKKSELSKLTVNGKTIRGQAFGVSVFEEEDDDIYGTEDMTNYDFTLEPEAEKKKIKKREYSQFDCIEGFHICAKPFQRKERFPLPQIPADYVPLKSRRSRWDSTERSEPRAKIKTITERVRIIDDDNTPSTSGTSKVSVVDKASEELIKKIDSMPPVPTSSFKPFALDSEKQSRYERFLMFRKFGLKDKFDLIYPPTMTEWDREREKSEFEQAARLYRPMSDDMANRFTVGGQEDATDLLKPVEKTRDLKQDVLIQAAKQKRFGALTRRKLNWMPDKVLCKRFNIPEPVAGHLEKSAEVAKNKGSRTSIFEFLKTTELPVHFEQSEKVDLKPEIKEEKLPPEQKKEVVEQQESTPVPEPVTETSRVNDTGDLTDDVKDITDKVDLFKAVFLSSSDEEDEADPEPEVSAISTRHLDPVNPIEYSPPRGIFKNLDLDLLRQKPTLPDKETASAEPGNVVEETSTTVPEASNTPLLPEIKEEEPQLYGPMIPKNLSTNAVVQPSHAFRPKSKKNDDVWVEKNHKHKKHKKRKKHKKHK